MSDLTQPRRKSSDKISATQQTAPALASAAVINPLTQNWNR